MSRSMSAAQVIALGEYLDPDFDPSTLTVSQLLGVFGFHNIRYPTPYTKPKLVQLFNDELKPKVKKFKKERIKKENSIASDDGIKDGVTGEFLNPKPALRRSSRRSSRAPSIEPEPVKQEPSKRRRSSAQPSLGGSSSRSGAPVAVQDTLIEESEPEEEVVVRKVGRGKKTSEDAGSRARRVSQVPCVVSQLEDSGWEDNNLFQSGAESSSPARPPPKPRTRKSAAKPPSKTTSGRRPSRKSTSAPPEYLPSSSPAASDEDEPPIHASPAPRATNFEPHLPPEILRENQNFASPQRTQNFASPQRTPFKTSISPLRLRAEEEIVEESDQEPGEDEDVAEGSEEESEDAKHANAVSRRIAEGGVVRRATPASSSSFVPRLLLFIALIASATVLLPYKQESASLGFCDTGSKTNDALENLRTRRVAVQACIRENRTTLYLPSTDRKSEEPCPGPSIIDELIPPPDACTPCPDRATCTRDAVTCNNGLLLRPHPVLSFLPFPTLNSLNISSPNIALSEPVDLVLRGVSFALDGMPRMGSVALPPRCVEDPRRKRHIGVLGKAIEAVLGQERGTRVCAGEVPPVKEEEGGEARRWGMDLEALRESMKKKTAPQLLTSFDDTFNEAIQQLNQWGGIVTSSDVDGKKYIAHKTPNLDLACTITVKSREVWKEWRLTVFSTSALILSAFVLRIRRAERKVEGKRVAELVQIALDTLRNQELAHHTDPITAPQPYLSSLQLRDLILQDEHSVGRRRRLWDQVERVVEGNANVRANLEEVQGGDELRVWRWVGSAGRRKVQFKGEEGRVVA
ncbi:Man1-Src1p-C-terminal domain-containing protein [Amylostereum chailletii]|nr:Man1-Src1p-C-terminal domain-containing protein [Amylostereum chailletii]